VRNVHAIQSLKVIMGLAWPGLSKPRGKQSTVLLYSTVSSYHIHPTIDDTPQLLWRHRSEAIQVSYLRRRSMTEKSSAVSMLQDAE
jgi:hypothetical protein